MKYLIVGLGNPGAEYEGTRHNAGFMALDRLADRSSVSFSPDRLGWRAEVKHHGRTLVLIKPSTYMNLSGKAVRYWLQKEGIPQEKLLVVVDDLALPTGTVRLRAKGSDAGHNGLKDIQAQLGNASYARLRLGIGSDFSRGKQVDYVLGRFEGEDEERIQEALVKAVDAIGLFATIGTERAMNQVNTNPKPKRTPPAQPPTPCE